MSALAEPLKDNAQTRATADARLKLALLVLALIAVWSLIFSSTFTRYFEWDDLHGIRSYSFFELLSTFYGPSDPDNIETPALRPTGTLVYHLQGTLFGENMIMQRAFMLALMATLLWVLGLLLLEVGLLFPHIAIVFVLFVSSRIFAALALWLVLSALIVTYIFVTLAALFYIRWTKRDSNHLLVLGCVFATLAVFAREEAYTLPAALPLIWWLSTSDREKYRRPLAGALVIFLIVATHYTLRTIFVRGAPQPDLHSLKVMKAVFSSWFPGGSSTIGTVDGLLKLGWIGFIVILTMLFIRTRDRRQQALALGVCILGVILCAPQLGSMRPFGLALPTLAFLTAIAIATINVMGSYLRKDRGPIRAASIGVCLVGLAIGITAGVRRSTYVAQSLDENAVTMVATNGRFVFDMFPHHHVTIPDMRRQTVIKHLHGLGVHSREDVAQLGQKLAFGTLGPLTPPMFLEKYDYMSW